MAEGEFWYDEYDMYSQTEGLATHGAHPPPSIAGPSAQPSPITQTVQTAKAVHVVNELGDAEYTLAADVDVHTKGKTRDTIYDHMPERDYLTPHTSQVNSRKTSAHSSRTTSLKHALLASDADATSARVSSEAPSRKSSTLARALGTMVKSVHVVNELGNAEYTIAGDDDEYGQDVAVQQGQLQQQQHHQQQRFSHQASQHSSETLQSKGMMQRPSQPHSATSSQHSNPLARALGTMVKSVHVVNELGNAEYTLAGDDDVQEQLQQQQQQQHFLTDPSLQSQPIFAASVSTNPATLVSPVESPRYLTRRTESTRSPKNLDASHQHVSETHQSHTDSLFETVVNGSTVCPTVPSAVQLPSSPSQSHTPTLSSDRSIASAKISSDVRHSALSSPSGVEVEHISTPTSERLDMGGFSEHRAAMQQHISPSQSPSSTLSSAGNSFQFEADPLSATRKLSQTALTSETHDDELSPSLIAKIGLQTRQAPQLQQDEDEDEDTAQTDASTIGTFSNAVIGQRVSSIQTTLIPKTEPVVASTATPLSFLERMKQMEQDSLKTQLRIQQETPEPEETMQADAHLPGKDQPSLTSGPQLVHNINFGSPVSSVSSYVPSDTSLGDLPDVTPAVQPKHSSDREVDTSHSSGAVTPTPRTLPTQKQTASTPKPATDVMSEYLAMMASTPQTTTTTVQPSLPQPQGSASPSLDVSDNMVELSIEGESIHSAPKDSSIAQDNSLSSEFLGSDLGSDLGSSFNQGSPVPLQPTSGLGDNGDDSETW
eukprot:m.327737 g.327737  ORF g.327737 m.327737 type:complete len:770 (-) comp16026_c2_seq3:259-2568(-)